MLKNLMIPKENIICIPESMSCLEAVQILEDNQLRNAPVVDASGNMFRGNIYRYHIYKYHFHHPEVDLSNYSVTYLLKNTTRTVIEDESVLNCLFMIKDLPYIVVLNKQHSFQGIIPHDSLLDYFQQAWVMEDLSCLISIRTRGFKGDLRKISRLINQFCDIGMAMTLEATDYNTATSIVYGIPRSIDQLKLKLLIQHLERRQYDFDVYYL